MGHMGHASLVSRKVFPVTRFFLTLGWIMLLVLLVDSAMNDPDVKPIVDRQFQRAGEALLTIIDWFQTQEVESSVRLQTPGSIQANEGDLLNGPASKWYWSTILGTAVMLLRRAKLAQAGMLRGVPVIASGSRYHGEILADRLA